MNNIYIDGEFVNRCNDCPFYNIETEVEFVGYEKTYHKCLVGGDIITGNCPLKPLSDRLKEERKRVVKEIRDSAGNYFELPYCDECGNSNGNDVVLTGNDLTEILDEIENE